MVPPPDAPEGGVELMSGRDGELVLSPVPLELVAPLPAAPEGPEPLTDVPPPDCVPPLLSEPEAPVPDVVGDADGV